jgi:hypothetical protein
MCGLTTVCTDSHHFPFLRVRLRVNMPVTPDSSSWISGHSTPLYYLQILVFKTKSAVWKGEK